MTSASKKTSTQKKTNLPIWAQFCIGLTFIGLIYWAAMNAHMYVSAWDEEDSSFFKNSMDSLHLQQVHPSGPTLVLFWHEDCDDCLTNFKQLDEIPGHIRIYGIHVSDEKSKKHKIVQLWNRQAPSHAALLMDRSDILKTSFRVRAIPSSFIILPKEKKIFSHVGLLKRSQHQMLKILKRL